MFAVPAGKGKLEKTPVRMSSSYIAPATGAERRYPGYLLVSAISPYGEYPLHCDIPWTVKFAKVT